MFPCSIDHRLRTFGTLPTVLPACVIFSAPPRCFFGHSLFLVGVSIEQPWNIYITCVISMFKTRVAIHRSVLGTESSVLVTRGHHPLPRRVLPPRACLPRPKTPASLRPTFSAIRTHQPPPSAERRLHLYACSQTNAQTPSNRIVPVRAARRSSRRGADANVRP